MKKIVRTDKAPLPIGPYNQAVVTGNLVYTAGQIAFDSAQNIVVGNTVAEQTKYLLNNLKVILEAAGSSLEKVIKTTVFLKDMNDFAAMNGIYSEYFKDATAPARTTIQVARLPKDVLVEVEAVAEIA